MVQELALKQAKEGGIRRDRAAEAEIKKQQALAAQARAGMCTRSPRRSLLLFGHVVNSSMILF